MAHPKNVLREAKLSGNIVVGEILRNMEVGRFEMTYTVLFPCIFTVYLNPADYGVLSGVFPFIVEDARRALRARVTELNSVPSVFGVARRAKSAKEHKIACRDWEIEFLPDSEVPPGDVEIHSELNEVAQPGYRGTKTTLMGREPSVTAQRTTSERFAARASDQVYAEIRYQDDSGPQVYLVTQNRVRVGRGGDDQPMDLALYTTDEVSREHLVIRREPGTGAFFIVDSSTNGTWVNGKRLRKGTEDVLPSSAQIGVGEVLTLSFEARK
ncbi:MAG: FHA domain-containing protein [Acidobacteriaceae bacterium]|nr:FHA domain-containing protein [Acidobacteriaceae bacterium]MBV9502295.1 FHA domain-containing protein [Acidobacteriaceae bacterium]